MARRSRTPAPPAPAPGEGVQWAIVQLVKDGDAIAADDTLPVWPSDADTAARLTAATQSWAQRLKLEVPQASADETSIVWDGREPLDGNRVARVPLVAGYRTAARTTLFSGGWLLTVELVDVAKRPLMCAGREVDLYDVVIDAPGRPPVLTLGSWTCEAGEHAAATVYPVRVVSLRCYTDGWRLDLGARTVTAGEEFCRQILEASSTHR